MARELNEALDLIENDKNIRAFILAAEGERAFCAGVDLKERKDMSADEKWKHTTLVRDALIKLDNLRVPTIAALHGFALGGGTELAICCDLRVMEEDAELGLTEVKLGIFPGAGGAVRLIRQISMGDAKDFLFTGRRINSKEALDMRFVQRVAKGKENVLEAAVDYAKQISMNGPLGVQAVKKVDNYGIEAPKEVALAYSEALRKPLDLTKDYAHALQAFSEKKTPTFTGE